MAQQTQPMRPGALTLALVTGSMLALAAPVGAQDTQGVPENVEAAFQVWDTDGDGRIRGDELIDGLRQVWAADDRIGEAEYAAGWNDWFGDTERPEFSEFDSDGDGILNQEELREAFASADLEEPWQGAEDGYLTPEEFASGYTAAMEAGAAERTGGVTTGQDAGADPAIQPPEVAPDVTVTPVCEGDNVPAAADCPPDGN